jgi:hypothetical protein
VLEGHRPSFVSANKAYSNRDLPACDGEILQNHTPVLDGVENEMPICSRDHCRFRQLGFNNVVVFTCLFRGLGGRPGLDRQLRNLI